MKKWNYLLHAHQQDNEAIREQPSVDRWYKLSVYAIFDYVQGIQRNGMIWI
ncbi:MULTISPECIES: hypothetical protein [Lysinibacillus]|uniref:hypothetical protein n=1 Tax=Lysinibacillus TaxID=400634 RepID=UPI00257C0848|nr:MULTISPECIES: hypothetical protein [Lysinibacillus]